MQKPWGGRAQQGRQRRRDMYFFAAEPFSAACTLQELLLIKSNDEKDCNEALNAIIKEKAISNSGTPESFKILMRELKKLGLRISVDEIHLNDKKVNRTSYIVLKI